MEYWSQGDSLHIVCAHTGAAQKSMTEVPAHSRNVPIAPTKVGYILKNGFEVPKVQFPNHCAHCITQDGLAKDNCDPMPFPNAQRCECGLRPEDVTTNCHGAVKDMGAVVV